MERLLDDLLVHEVGCAPHVACRLAEALHDDAPAIRQVAGRLTRAQRQGLAPLPSPLPLVPSILQEFEQLDLSQHDRELLLALAVSLDDDLDPLLAFDGRSAEELSASAVGKLLVMRAGRIRMTDPRLAAWILHATSSADLSAVHDRLRQVFVGRGGTFSADWHRARASLRADQTAAPELVRIARRLSEAGLADRSLMVAREAISHAQGTDLHAARLAAGAAAMSAGYAMEAAALLGTLFPEGPERYRLHGLRGLLLAQAHLQGTVPDVDPASFRPSTDDPGDWRAWARAAALAAPLCAERGDRQGMRAWLEALRESTARVGADATLRDPAVALSWLLLGEGESGKELGSGPVCGGLFRALLTAIDGDIDGGVRLLAHDAAMGAGADPLVEGYERSPLVDAYRAVTHVLLLVWRGDMSTAREELIRASTTLPVAVPFAGLGVVLARRLDLAVRGELSPFSRALSAALPAGNKLDVLVDRGIHAFLAGDFDTASGFVRLWFELGAPRSMLSVPGLDEVAVAADARPPRVLEPAETARAEQLLLRIATATDGPWEAERSAIARAARSLRSPFARGRIESLLGTQSAIRGDRFTAREHLVTARSLFDLCGARAWARAAEDRLVRLDAEDAPASSDPLAVCRRAWGQRLTDRELEVAMRAVAGASNRDIGEALMVSVRTVEVHLGRAFAKLDVRNRIELTILAHRTGQHL